MRLWQRLWRLNSRDSEKIQSDLGRGIALWKLGADGHVEWNRTYTRGSGESLIKQQSGYAIAGIQTAEVAFLTINESGTLRSFAKFKREGFGYGYLIAKAEDDKYIIAGRYQSIDTPSSHNALILKLDEDP